MSKQQYKRPSSQELKKAASGNWLAIFKDLSPNLEEAISKLGSHVPSPARGGTDGFRLKKCANISGEAYDNQEGFISNGIDVLMYATGQDFNTVFNSVWNWMKNNGFGPSLENINVQVDTPKVGKSKEENKRLYQSMETVWRIGKPLSGAYYSSSDFAHQYFNKRGISSGVLAEQPNLKIMDKLFTKKDSKSVTTKGIVAKVQDSEGNLVGVHRTFLDENGNKAFEGSSARKMMAMPDNLTISGGAIRLSGGSVAGFLSIAEGIETALSVTDATGIACWSVLNANGIRSFVPPKGVHTVVVFADKDKPSLATGYAEGQQAAKDLRARLTESGIRVLTVLPKEPIPENAKSLDWNDVLKNGGSFPTFENIKSA